MDEFASCFPVFISTSSHTTVVVPMSIATPKILSVVFPFSILIISSSYITAVYSPSEYSISSKLSRLILFFIPVAFLNCSSKGV